MMFLHTSAFHYYHIGFSKRDWGQFVLWHQERDNFSYDWIAVDEVL